MSRPVSVQVWDQVLCAAADVLVDKLPGRLTTPIQIELSYEIKKHVLLWHPFKVSDLEKVVS